MRKTIYIKDEGVWLDILKKSKAEGMSPSEYLVGGNYVGPDTYTREYFKKLEMERNIGRAIDPAYKASHPGEKCFGCDNKHRDCQCQA
jgi:hypothetical protein